MPFYFFHTRRVKRNASKIFKGLLIAMEEAGASPVRLGNKRKIFLELAGNFLPSTWSVIRLYYRSLLLIQSNYCILMHSVATISNHLFCCTANCYFAPQSTKTALIIYTAQTYCTSQGVTVKYLEVSSGTYRMPTSPDRNSYLGSKHRPMCVGCAFSYGSRWSLEGICSLQSTGVDSLLFCYYRIISYSIISYHIISI